MSGNFLGVDQSYNSTGFVLVSIDKQVVDFGILKSSKDDDVYDRALFIATSIRDICIKYQPAKVSIEGLAFGMTGNVTRDLAGLIFVLITTLKTNKLADDIRIVAPTELKKYATGSGKAKKPDMINALPPEVLYTFASAGFKKTTGLTDLADAYWLACINT